MCFKSQRTTQWGTPNKKKRHFLNFFDIHSFIHHLFIYSIFVYIVICPESGACYSSLKDSLQCFSFWQICYQQEPAAFIWESWNFFRFWRVGVLKSCWSTVVSLQCFYHPPITFWPLGFWWEDGTNFPEDSLFVDILYSLAAFKGICKSIH